VCPKLFYNLIMEKILNIDEYDWLTRDPIQNTYFITKNDICYKENEKQKLFAGVENVDRSGLVESHITNPEGYKFSHVYSGKNTIIHGGGNRMLI
jgi:hypothetical protein